ncbi:MAG: CBS domain-containing protein [Longispora sp.]|nr:CBS domain-containing protein [Longispora sp. (in: high G+C Gram-positive bacteria)]
MRAVELAIEYPTVALDTLAVEAARLLAGQNLPGLIVVDKAGLPVTILPGTQVLRLAVPSYIQDDPALARVVDEAHADLFLRELGQRTVADCLPREQRELPVVGPRATVMEIAALMARTRSPVVAVVEKGAGLLGAITLDVLLDRLVSS